MWARINMLAAGALLLSGLHAQVPAEEVEELEMSGSVSAGVTVSATISGNRVEEDGVSNSVSIEASFQGNSGLVVTNQAAGHLNQQSNVQVIAIGSGAGTGLTATASGGTVLVTDNTVVTADGERSTRIGGSFTGSSGMVAVNQSAGNLNHQSNTAAIAVGIGLDEAAITLGETDLEALSGGNTSERKGEHSRSDVISGSFGGFAGTAQVTQSSGDGNVVRNNLNVSVRVMQ